MRIYTNMRTVFSVLIVLLLVSTLNPTTSFAQDSSVYMYWAEWQGRKIRRAHFDGTNIEDLVTTGLANASDMALDMANGKMYWTDWGTAKVQCANLDGTNVEDLVTGVVPDGIALDLTNRKMYLIGRSKIQRANLDGTGIEDLVTTGLSLADDMALDIVNGKMYWTNRGMGKIQRANLDGINVEDLVPGLRNPSGIALDVAGNKMYWTDESMGKVQRANLDGTNVEDLITTGLRNTEDIELDLASGKMYWTDFGTHNIQRANLDGTNVEDLITTGLRGPVGIALGVPQVPPGDGLRFSPSEIADQTFTVGTSVDLTLPSATDGTPPYTYRLAPSLPAGLYFDPIGDGPGYIGGTPTAAMPPTPFTYTATDATSASASLTFTITVTSDGTSNLDVNGDGQVTVVDLAIVALFYGTQVPANISLPADVNADGVVDLADLTAIAEGIDAAGGGVDQLSVADVEQALLVAAEQAVALEAAAGAPMRAGMPRSAVSVDSAYRNVANALAAARSDVWKLHKGFAVLEVFLALLAEMGAIPETTALLPNYPNPFNPETWIPYHLTKDAEVIVRIYDMRGVSVRELVLGHQAAGVYQSRGRAAYWDGRNHHGEPVASGLYFYTLTAGDFTATRKLLIAK